MSNGGGASATLTLPAGGTGTATLAAPTTHVCELPKPVLFPTARSFIPATADNKAAFQDLLTRLKLGGSLDHLLITGHTDSVGDAGTNQALSVRRTQSVQAVLQGNTTAWDTLSSVEGWGATEVNAMVAEVGPPPTPRADLVRRYFAALLGGATVPPIQATAPPQLGCGQSQLLHGSRSAPSRDTTQPPIQGEFQPNRRVEFFFFDNSGASISCSEYPKWTLLCSLTPPPPPVVTVTLSPLTSVAVNQDVDVQVTINPSPLTAGDSITLTLSTTSGSGSAIFKGSNSATTTVTASGPVTIRGITGSSLPNNIHIAATRTGTVAVLAQEDFTVTAAISIFLKFEVWDTNTVAVVPLPPGVDVQIVQHKSLLPNVPLATGQTDAHGQVFFNQATLGQGTPDIFFLVETNSRTHAHTTLPPEWSTKGWKAVDGNPGFIPKYNGAPIGSPPSSPRVFRVGLDFHFRFEYLKGLVGSPFEPASRRIPIEVHVDKNRGSPPKQNLLTDANGELHGQIFDISPQDDLWLHMSFEMTDPDINLPRTVVVPDGTNPSAWSTFFSDADQQLFDNLDQTSIGTQTGAPGPVVLKITVKQRNVALFFLKILREWSTFLFHITKHAWAGVQGLQMFPSLLPFATSDHSFPVGEVHIQPSRHFSRSTLVHELSHQIMWQECHITTVDIVKIFLPPNKLYIADHNDDIFTTPNTAFIEGWSLFMESIFGTRPTIPSVGGALQIRVAGATQPLGPPPLNKGESVEGAFAEGLFGIFQNRVVTNAVAAGPVISESKNGDITVPTWLSNGTVQDRFLAMIWRPLQNVRGIGNINDKTTTAMIGTIRSGNPAADWRFLLSELQAFNMAMFRPTVTGISPTGGPAAGGTRVAITGTDFTSTNTSVTFGGTPATVNLDVTGPTTSAALLRVDTPAHALGPADVVVTTLAGASAPFSFLYAPVPTVTSVRVTGDPPGTPARGPTTGGTKVTITGTDFLPGAQVFFGGLPPAGVAATNVLSPSPTTITADSPVFALPAHSPGLVDVTVRNPDGQVGTLAGSFEYFKLPGPVISLATPTTGPRAGGTPVKITGSNFRSGVVVEIGGIAANIDVSTLTSTNIDILTPAAASSAPASVDIRVVNPDGQDDIVKGGFTYTP
jgi:flagellin-like hook-associated protein FlgL